MKDQIFHNIFAILQEAGSSLKNIVKVNIFRTDMSKFQIMNEAYAKKIPDGIKPVRTCVAVKELPFGSDVEIECIAALDTV
ncbi:Endoribonuclease L-PSP/chorismate mutase-like protein [Aspergillus sergii]|uniref:Endoribonuclease L-PSP/chorismate mutase-like protein n=1 Tax=Aspergillus sergii TaxID=1034303 RepID=A0A5N6XDW3_9EURO|nr:Endoribonuclease L-PSP/chorismate mutase-like protein [Aspergillus sergii]